MAASATGTSPSHHTAFSLKKDNNGGASDTALGSLTTDSITRNVLDQLATLPGVGGHPPTPSAVHIVHQRRFLSPAKQRCGTPNCTLLAASVAGVLGLLHTLIWLFRHRRSEGFFG